jgi:polyphosphate kinase
MTTRNMNHIEEKDNLPVAALVSADEIPKGTDSGNMAFPAETFPIPPMEIEEEYHLINRELSWLAFNERVMAEAANHHHPLLERLRFIAISASNLDEFLTVRVAGLKHLVKNGNKLDYYNSFVTPQHQLEEIDERVRHLLEHQQTILPILLKELSAHDVSVISLDKVTEADKEYIKEHILEDIIQVITPQTLDPAHPFPFIANNGFGMFLSLEDDNKKNKTALILLSPVLNRFFALSGEGARFITLEDTILLNLDEIFPEHKLVNHVLFRVIRDSEIEFDEEAEDLVASFENAVRARRRGNVIALQLSSEGPDEMTNVLANKLMVSDNDIDYVGGMIGLSDLSQICNAGSNDLRFPPYSARFPERIRDFGGDCFAAIRSKDILVHHPYESFDVVLQFLRQAAEDPKVISIRQTLYRTLPDSPIVRALIAAAEAGKSVTAMVEIKARFDEEVNIRLARALERAGVQVVFGFVDLKTHAKLSLIVRQEENGLRSYAHCGTGNYHPMTAKVYTDLSYFTCDQSICADIVRIFNYMTSYVKPAKLNKVKFAPVSARDMFTEAVKSEIAAAKRGEPSGIWLKLNAIVDKASIDLLYEASQAGVPIELVVRGICCLRPGIKGLSENIRVRSLIGRFLEHSRIYIFANGAPLPSPQAKVYIASADLMPRNLDRRVEVFMPIENPTVHLQIMDQIMMTNINDTSNTWLLQSDGRYIRHPEAETNPFSAHHFFMTNPSLSGRGSALDEPYHQHPEER